MTYLDTWLTVGAINAFFLCCLCQRINGKITKRNYFEFLGVFFLGFVGLIFTIEVCAMYYYKRKNSGKLKFKKDKCKNLNLF